MEFVFQISPCNNPALPQQVSFALKKRTELIAKAKYPRVWKVIDRLHTKKAPESVLERRRIRYRIYGMLLLAMGLFLLIPGLLEPKELFAPLIAGILGVAAGVCTLWSGRNQPDRRFDRAAGKLLKGLEAVPAVQVAFTPEGMRVAGQETVPYALFDCGIETGELFLFTWNGKITVIQKQDMVEGKSEEFRSFLREQIKFPAQFYSVY